MEAIYAVDVKNGLSKNGIIPWKSVKDLKFFYNTTKNNIVLMGSNTYFSLPNEVKPLTKRLNIVLTTRPEHYIVDNCYHNNLIFTKDTKIYETIFNNREKYLRLYSFLHNDFKIFIIGGKNIYDQFISLCETVWVTRIKKDYICDLLFNYDFTKQFNEQTIQDDEELSITKYNKI